MACTSICNWRKEFIGNDKVALILGDNIFYGSSMSNLLQANNDPDGESFYAYHVSDPEDMEWLSLTKIKLLFSIEEKPLKPKSNFAV